MSASAAKVSKKELNSNHDGAEETSGKEWRPCEHRHFHFLLFLRMELCKCPTNSLIIACLSQTVYVPYALKYFWLGRS